MSSIEHRLGASQSVSRKAAEPHKEIMRAPEELIISHLSPDPYKPGLQNVVLKATQMHIWQLIAYQQSLHADVENKVEQTAKDYEISREQLAATNAYYDRHRCVIDAQILLEKARYETDPLFKASDE